MSSPPVRLIFPFVTDTKIPSTGRKMMVIRIRKTYSQDFKEEAVRLARTLGRAKSVKHIGVSVLTLDNWEKTKQTEKKLSAEDQAEADRKELIQLRKENAELKDAVHILKRAAAVFSKDQLTQNIG